MAAEFKSLRRYYLSRRQAAWEAGDRAISNLLQHKQEAESGGVALPTGFPSKAALEAAGYVAYEDLVGADECELVDQAGLSNRAAQAVLTAYAEL